MREIYETAVEAEPPYALSDLDCKTMCCRYARLERQVCVRRPALGTALRQSLADGLLRPSCWDPVG